ncbi:heat shock protein 90 [Enhygromyxa salina]|uniref:Heat shock protein 90 n=1 Tax=Enhygromyxa salina TaxID=215803 RepID=A0A2S9XIT0_9BACT|nr:ATP-binding protein [Enhygromyxa salina]PRP92786.1 heat shock protein 90 [Enhygromyxa salina]
MSGAPNEASEVGDALETLVHQFSDPWSFLRELIQNAIDAGSPEIDLRIDHEPPDDPNGDDPGLMIVEVVDAGAGMDRQIIDTRLTRLFSSAKDGDYTKIGRFGIGFVSVFAIEPDLVCVDTGRTGEYWRVLFRKDRSFQRIALEHPTEGTTIRIYKHATPAEVERARARAREILEYWCKHARVEVRCDDELISRPFELDARCVVRHEEEGTLLLLGYVDQREALRGYYHGGLTLHEERDDRLPHVAFKIDSRYIEHTLTRDDVIRDDNFVKAMNIVGRLARTRLVEELVATLERLTAAATDEPGEARELELLRARLLNVIDDHGEPPELVFERPIVPALRAEGGPELLSLARVRKRIERCWTASLASPVTAALLARGDTVLLCPDDSVLTELLARVCGRAPKPVTSLCTAIPATTVERERWQPLRDATLALLERQDARVADIALAHLAYPRSPVADHVAITQRVLGELTAIEDIGQLSSGWFGAKRLVVLNADHPTVSHLLEVARVEPEIAAYLLLKLFYLRGGADVGFGPERDNKLASHAVEARWQRSMT